MALAWWLGPIWQPFKWTTSAENQHSGIDIGLPWGTPYTAILPGTVTVAAWEPWGYQVSYVSNIPGIGQVTISGLHGSELDSFVGQQVTPGQVIMKTGAPPAVYNPDGSLKYGSGNHLHFEVNTGNLAPYVQYNVQNAPGGNHPIDGSFLLAGASATLGGVSQNIGNNLANLGIIPDIPGISKGFQQAAQTVQGFTLDPSKLIPEAWAALTKQFTWLPDLGWDALKIGIGFLLIGGVVIMLIFDVVFKAVINFVGIGGMVQGTKAIKPAAKAPSAAKAATAAKVVEA